MLVYVNTAAFIALAHKRDALDEKTVAVYKNHLDKKTRFLTTNAVLHKIPYNTDTMTGYGGSAAYRDVGTSSNALGQEARK